MAGGVRAHQLCSGCKWNCRVGWGPTARFWTSQPGGGGSGGPTHSPLQIHVSCLSSLLGSHSSALCGPIVVVGSVVWGWECAFPPRVSPVFPGGPDGLERSASPLPALPRTHNAAPHTIVHHPPPGPRLLPYCVDAVWPPGVPASPHRPAEALPSPQTLTSSSGSRGRFICSFPRRSQGAHPGLRSGPAPSPVLQTRLVWPCRGCLDALFSAGRVALSDSHLNGILSSSNK